MSGESQRDLCRELTAVVLLSVVWRVIGKWCVSSALFSMCLKASYNKHSTVDTMSTGVDPWGVGTGGTYQGPRTKAWFLVHPMSMETYWVTRRRHSDLFRAATSASS